MRLSAFRPCILFECLYLFLSNWWENDRLPGFRDFRRCELEKYRWYNYTESIIERWLTMTGQENENISNYKLCSVLKKTKLFLKII